MFIFYALFSPFLICADKDAHENSSFYYINPHEFQSWASLSAQTKKGKNDEFHFRLETFEKVKITKIDITYLDLPSPVKYENSTPYRSAFVRYVHQGVIIGLRAHKQKCEKQGKN